MNGKMTYLVTAKKKLSENSTVKENHKHGRTTVGSRREAHRARNPISLSFRNDSNRGTLKRIRFITSLASCTITYDCHCLFGMEVSNYL